jgi:hypothetical protein
MALVSSCANLRSNASLPLLKSAIYLFSNGQPKVELATRNCGEGTLVNDRTWKGEVIWRS